MTPHSRPKSVTLILEQDVDDGGWKPPKMHWNGVLKADKIIKKLYLAIYTGITQVPDGEAEEEGKVMRKHCLNVSEKSFTRILNWIVVSCLPFPENDLSIYLTKGCSWLEVSLHTMVSECDMLRKAIHHITENLGLSQIYRVKEVTWKALAPSSPVVTNSPSPQHNWGNYMAKQTCQPVFFLQSPLWYSLQKGT